tara:strand:+ start:479 stop:847 length:369 start_codon:yes stop_codon:yes gene_type:complete
MELIKGFRVPQKSTVIYPDESILKSVEKKFGKSIKQIKNHPEYVQLITDFVLDSESIFRGNNGNFITSKGQRYFVDFDTGIVIDTSTGVKIKIISNYVKNDIRFVSIRGIITTPERVRSIKG